MQPNPLHKARSMFEEHRWSVFLHFLDRAPQTGHLLEIGCHAAGVTRYMADRYPDRPVVAFDRFEDGLSAPTTEDGDMGNGYHEGAQANSLANVYGWLADCPNVRVVNGDVRTTLRVEPPYEVALAVVDVNLYEPTLAALKWLTPRMMPGGFILVDDVDFRGVDHALRTLNLDYEHCGYMGVVK